MTLKELSKLSAEQLDLWLLERMRGERFDPPIVEMHGELPTTFVEQAIDHGDPGLQTRLRDAVSRLLGQLVDVGNLREPANATAAGFLCDLAGFFEIGDSASAVLRLIHRSELEALDPSLLAAAYTAFAILQPPHTYADEVWMPLWRGNAAKFWPVATAGLRRSDPAKALEILPEIIARGRGTDYPLGETLYAYLDDPEITRLLMDGTPLDEQEYHFCVAAATTFGLPPEMIAPLAPRTNEPPPEAGNGLPAWAASRNASTSVPQLSTAA